jgi:DNA-binding beta-propeller fold protein YncE
MEAQNTALRAMLQPALKLPMEPGSLAVGAPSTAGWALGMVSWGKGLYSTPHAIRVDPQGNVWTADAASSRVYKFTPDGTLLLTIEVGGQPTPCGNFCGTTDMAFAGDGHVFIADGYRNARILEYTAEGKKVSEWGRAGTGPGEFRLPHSIQIDERGIIYVADRENGRIQRFDRSGKFLGEWTQYGKTFGLALVGDALWLSTIPRARTPRRAG